jgi:hypothetical protein
MATKPTITTEMIGAIGMASKDAFELDTEETHGLQEEGEEGEEEVVEEPEAQDSDEDETSDREAIPEPDEVQDSEDETSDEEVSPEPEEAQEEVEVKKEEPVKRAKPVVVKTKRGDEIRLNADAKVKLRVDGQDVEVSIDEWRRGYASHASTKKNWEEIQATKREIEETAKEAVEKITEQALEFKQSVQEIADKVKSDPQNGGILAVADLLEALGIDAYPVITAFRRRILEEAKGLADAGEPAWQAYDMMQELSYLKYREGRKKELDEKRTLKDNEEKAIAEAIKKYKIPNKEAYKRYAAELETLQKSGQVSLPSINSDVIGQYHIGFKAGQLVEEVTREVAPQLLRDADLMNRIVRTVIEYDPTKEQLTEVLKQYSATESKPVEAPKGAKKLSFKANPTQTGGKKKGAGDSKDLFF